MCKRYIIIKRVTATFPHNLVFVFEGNVACQLILFETDLEYSLVLTSLRMVFDNIVSERFNHILSALTFAVHRQCHTISCLM